MAADLVCIANLLNNKHLFIGLALKVFNKLNDLDLKALHDENIVLTNY